MAFCDYCLCAECQSGVGPHPLTHASTADGRHICDICYTYDVCTSGPDRNKNGPCEELTCSHRPAITSAWTSLAEDVSSS